MGSTSTNSSSSDSYDLSFKILLIGDAGVGKSSLISSFVSNSEQKENLPSTIGVDFRIKLFTVDGKKLKLTIWDTVYDVTRRETFTNMTNIWSKEIQQHSPNQNYIKVLVGNKVDKESERVVTKEEGTALAKANGFIYFECSARTRENVEKCFEELARKILTDHVRLEEGSKDVKKANEKSGADPILQDEGSKDLKNANEKSGADAVLQDEGSKDVKNANEKSGADPVLQDEGSKDVKNASEKSSSGSGGASGGGGHSDDGGCGVM